LQFIDNYDYITCVLRNLNISLAKDTSYILAVGLILCFHGSVFNIFRIIKNISNSIFIDIGYYANECSFNRQNEVYEVHTVIETSHCISLVSAEEAQINDKHF